MTNLILKNINHIYRNPLRLANTFSTTNINWFYASTPVLADNNSLRNNVNLTPITQTNELSEITATPVNSNNTEVIVPLVPLTSTGVAFVGNNIVTETNIEVQPLNEGVQEVLTQAVLQRARRDGVFNEVYNTPLRRVLNNTNRSVLNTVTTNSNRVPLPSVLNPTNRSPLPSGTNTINRAPLNSVPNTVNSSSVNNTLNDAGIALNEANNTSNTSASNIVVSTPESLME